MNRTYIMSTLRKNTLLKKKKNNFFFKIIYYPWNHCESKKFFSRYQITWLNNSVMIINWSKRLLPRRKKCNNFIPPFFQEIHLVRWLRTQSSFSQKVGEMNNLTPFIALVLLYAILFKQQQRLAILHLRRDTKTRREFVTVSKLR